VAATVEEDSDIIVAKEEGKQSKQESKQASSKHIEELIVGASFRFGLCLLQKVFGVLLLIFCGSLVLGS